MGKSSRQRRRQRHEQRHVRFLDDAVQVLVQPVEEILTEFLAVMLVVVVELRGEEAHRHFERPRRDDGILARINLVQEVGVRRGHLAAAPQRIPFVDFLLVLALAKVLRYWLDVIDALKNRVHVARIAQVVQAHCPRCWRDATKRFSDKVRTVNVVERLHHFHRLSLGFHGVVQRGAGGIVSPFRGLVGVYFADLFAKEIDPSTKWRVGDGLCALSWRREWGRRAIMNLLRDFHQDLRGTEMIFVSERTRT